MIKFVSEIGPSGYGLAGRGYLRALRSIGVPLTWTPMTVGPEWGMYMQPYASRDIDDEFGDLCNRDVHYDVVMVNLIGDYFSRWRAAEAGKKLIGVTVWETGRLQEGSLDDYACLDAMVVPCRWNQEVFRKGGIACPIHVAPHVHTGGDGDAADLVEAGIRSDDYVFYGIGEWKERKGMHLTVESFCRAFTRDDPVVLVLKTTATNERRRASGRWWWYVGRHVETSRRDLARIMRGHRSSPRVVLISGDQPARRIRALHARGDCYVSLTRAEGWGLGAYEAAFAGNPVIMTGHGGQLDFLPESLSYQVNFQLVTAKPTGLTEAGYRGHLWAEPDLDHGARLMREVFANRAEARERGRRLRAFVKREFEPKRIARGLLDFVNQVAATPAHPCRQSP